MRFNRSPHGPQITLRRRIERSLAIARKLRDGDGCQDADDRDDDQQLDEGKTLLVFLEL